MAQGTLVTPDATERLLSELVVAMGGAAPPSGGLGELLAAIVNAVGGFTPPSLDAIALAPAGAVAQSVPRSLLNSVAEAVVSGTLQMQAIALPANTVINNINFLTGSTAAITPTHQWAGLYDKNGVLLAISADGTTTAITAGETLTYPIATIAAGAATKFTTTYTGLYYVGVLVVAGTTPTFEGLTSESVANTVPPITAGASDTGLTTPSAFPHTATAITPAAGNIYTYLT